MTRTTYRTLDATFSSATLRIAVHKLSRDRSSAVTLKIGQSAFLETRVTNRLLNRETVVYSHLRLRARFVPQSRHPLFARSRIAQFRTPFYFRLVSSPSPSPSFRSSLFLYFGRKTASDGAQLSADVSPVSRQPTFVRERGL